MITARLLGAYLRPLVRSYLALERIDLDSLPPSRPDHEYGLYAHVPFCESLCNFCTFNRFIFHEEAARAYFRRLREEMRLVAELGYRGSSLYVGGGTPTILIDELAETIVLARGLFGAREVSCETNPNHLTPEILGRLEGLVERLSVGVQSFDDDLLRNMGRFQRYGSGEEIFRRIRDVRDRFPLFNVDMIFNFPSQTEEVLRQDLERVVETGANQVSFYPLMTSPSSRQALESIVGRVDEEREARYYEIVCRKLEKHYEYSSPWSFSRSATLIDEYIVRSEEYVGLGSGAFSYLDGTLYINHFSLEQYHRAVDSGRTSAFARRRYHRKARMRYRFMMELFGLRLDKRRFRRDFGVGVTRGLPLEMAFLRATRAFAKDDGRELVLAPGGRYYLVVIMREFFSGVNYIRDEARRTLNREELACASLPFVSSGRSSEQPASAAGGGGR